MAQIEKELTKIKCPYCGYVMPIYKSKKAVARGIFVKCKGRNCKRVFELNTENKEIK